MNFPQKKSNVRVNSQTHFKRLGRELAMQYLYLRDMTPETDSVDDVEKAREMFWEVFFVTVFTYQREAYSENPV